MYTRGDHVFLTDLPRRFLCRVVDAESFNVGSARSQMLKLAPLEGPWTPDTLLIRLDHSVTPCEVRSRWSKTASRGRAHRGVPNAA